MQGLCLRWLCSWGRGIEKVMCGGVVCELGETRALLFRPRLHMQLRWVTETEVGSLPLKAPAFMDLVLQALRHVLHASI